MKKIAVFLFISLLFPVLATAQTLHNMETATVAWDAVSKPLCASSGTPTAVCPTPGGPAAGVVKYQVYGTNNLVDKVGVKIGGELTATQLLISNTLNVTTFIGVESLFYGTGGAAVQKSTAKAWSTVAADCAGGATFGFLYKLPDIPPPPPPATAGGMRTLIP
jgi:hypothetical protein